jgi:hypothetical protein
MNQCLRAICFVLLSATVSSAQVNVTVEKSPEGVYTYTYIVRNDTAEFTISSFVLYIPAKVSAELISPDGWIGTADEFIADDGGRVLVSDVIWECNDLLKGVLPGEVLTGFILKSKHPPRQAGVMTYFSKQGLAQHSTKLDIVGPSTALTGDIDLDSDVDGDDVQLIKTALNISVKPGDARDIDGDGRVTESDARQCTLKCTRPDCGTNETSTTFQPATK